MRRSVPVALALLSSACAEPVTSVADVAVGNADFTELVRSVIRLGLVETLDDRDASFTVFAPTDAAFEGVDTAALTDELLAAVVTHHVVAGQTLTAARLPRTLPSLSANAWGHPLTLVTSQVPALSVDGVDVALPDVVADNGVIHAVEQLLMPPDVRTMASLLGASTFLAKVEAAADVADGDALTDVLGLAGPFTVFLPTEAAFGAAAEVLADLEPAELSRVWAHHVVAGAAPVVVAEAADGSLLALSGEPLVLSGSGTLADGAPISLADVHVTNGVVHLVDQVLLPPSLR